MGLETVVVLSAVVTMVIMGVSSQQMPDMNATVRYPFVTQLDQTGHYILRWGHDSTDIWFEVQVRTLGYVAFGISEEGTMFPADVVVGYIVDNTIFFVDYKTHGYVRPEVDMSQTDWKLEQGWSINGWTVLRFNRSLDTCDDVGDIIITRDTQHLIYAYHSDVPPSYDQLMTHQFKGSKNVDLLTTSPPPDQFPPQTSHIHFRNHYTIPMSDANHHCRVFYLNSSTGLSQQKHHIVKILPIFNMTTIDNVKKITLYRCRLSRSSQQMGGDSFDCFLDNARTMRYCKEYVISFVPGAQDFYLPDDMGIAFGGADGADMYVLATEYDNMNRVANLVDNSGINIWYTPNLRKHDAAFMTIASPIAGAWNQFIPPFIHNFTERAYCSQDCIRWGFDATPANQITLAGALFEARRLGSGMRLRHLVAGASPGETDERPWVFDNQNYLFDTQSVLLPEMRHTVTKNNTLLLECTYDTTGETTYTLGGWADNTEFCRAHVLYYPAIPLEGCFSWSLFDTVNTRGGVRIPSDQIFDALANTTWSTGMSKYLQDAQFTAKHNAQCWSSRQNRPYHEHRFDQPIVSKPYKETHTRNCNVFTG